MTILYLEFFVIVLYDVFPITDVAKNSFVKVNGFGKLLLMHFQSNYIIYCVNRRNLT